MLKIKKILVPTDLKGKSVTGIKYAVSLAREYGAEVILLYVVDGGIMPRTTLVPLEGEVLIQREWVPAGGGTRRLIEAQLQNQRLRLLAFLRQHIGSETLGTIKFTQIIRFGDIAEEIVNVAVQEECDLVIMASRGRGWLARMVSGSMSEKIAREAPCPVVTIQPSAVVHEGGHRVPARSLGIMEV